MTDKLSMHILVGKNEGESFNLENGRTYYVGRHSVNNIIISDPNISRNHLKVKIQDNKFFITDLFSKNGTFTDGRDLIPGEETEVNEGVPIVIGSTILGVGDSSKSLLKPFFDSCGFSDQIYEDAEITGQDGVTRIKKNLELIYNTSNSMMECKDIEGILHILSKNIFYLLKEIDHCVVLVFDENTKKIRYIKSHSRKPFERSKKVFNTEIVKKVLKMDKPVVIDDSANFDDEDEKLTESLRIMKIRSAICVPIDGRFGTKGAIYVDSRERPYGFRSSDIALLKDIGSRASLAIDFHSLEEL